MEIMLTISTSHPAQSGGSPSRALEQLKNILDFQYSWTDDDLSLFADLDDMALMVGAMLPYTGE
jgi:hypothetical protein